MTPFPTRKKCLFPALVFLFALFFACGCNYHGRLKRNLYHATPFDEKIEASVLVPADQFLQQTFSFKDPNISRTQTFVLRTNDGAAVAVADALGTLFSRVEVDAYTRRSQYDYVAEVDYAVTRSDYLIDCRAHWDERSFLWFRKYYVPQVTTHLKLTLRNPHTRQPVLQQSAQRTSFVEYGTVSQVFYFTNRATLSLLYPVFGPAYAHSAGKDLAKTLEKDLVSCLKEIMPKLAENRLLFSKTHKAEAFPRNDAAFRPLLEKVVFLEVDDGIGSGFFISPDGYLLTNAHVVGNNRDVRYYLYQDLPFETGRADTPQRYARVVKKNTKRDLALLKAEGEFPYFELETDRSRYKTGATVWALGNPMAEKWAVTEGIISAISNKNGWDVLQTDAAISQGNSGGPLVARDSGKVLGITFGGIPSGDGVGFVQTAFEVQRTLGLSFPIDEERLEAEETAALPLHKQK